MEVTKRNPRSSEEGRSNSWSRGDIKLEDNSFIQTKEEVDTFRNDETVSVSTQEETKDKSNLQKIKTFLIAFRNWIGSIVSRTAFLVTSAVFVGLAISSRLNNIELSYLLLAPFPLMILEAVMTMYFRSNKEWKWVTPSTLVLLMCTVPSVWIIEFQRYHNREDVKRNITTMQCEMDFSILAPNISFDGSVLTALTDTAQQFCLCTDCPQVMEQVLLLILILGRWILPRASSLTVDEKAQLLLINIGVAADILDLFELLRADAVMVNVDLMVGVLAIWSLSLFQFVIVSTAVAKKGEGFCEIFESELWSLLALLSLDDLPFLLLRLVCIARFSVVSYKVYFFTAKNFLILVFDINRMIALISDIRKERAAERDRQLIHIRR